MGADADTVCVMSLTEALLAALRALRANRMRSALTVLGIVVGVAAVVCMVAVGAGAQAQVAETMRTLGANLLIVVPGAQASGGARLSAGTRQTLTEEDAAAIARRVPGIEISSPLVSRNVQVIAGNQNWATLVAGIHPDYLLAREWPMAHGRMFTAREVEAGAKVTVIGSMIAEQLFGGHVRLGEVLRIGSIPFTIIGELDTKGQAGSGRSQDDVVFIPLSAAQSRVLGSEREGLDFIALKLADAASVASAKRRVAALLRERHHLRREAADDFSIQNPADVLSAREDALRTFALLLTAVASVSLVVGGISIMNIMLVSVTERTREIGLCIAVGARRGDIRRQFLVEATALALIGGFVGAFAGGVAAAFVAWYANWPVLISWWTIVLACGFASSVGICFGVYPAYRASQLDPMVALRFE